MRIAIIGAGLGGVATAVALQRAGVDTVTVFERAAGPGGVWWRNTYPGCEVDVPSLAYSFSFMPYDWSRSHASQPELQRYVEDTIDHFGIRDRFHFGVDVSAVVWDEAAGAYTLHAGDAVVGQFEVVVSCVGMLSDPRLPDWPGLDRFAGPAFHTADFDHDVDLAGKRVALIGTGSTACQLGPAIAPLVGQLDLYQREPGYVLPKKVTDVGDLGGPFKRRWRRFRLFHETWKQRDAFEVDSASQRSIREYCVGSIHRHVADPEVREALTPDYAYGCKRPVFASGYYPMFNRDNVTLVPHPVMKVTETGVVDDTGIERPTDVIIMSTGFEAARYLTSLRVSGRDGRDLHEWWGDEPSAFLGMTVPGFPNFFMLYGPNTNGGWSVIAQLEPQARLVARTARRLARGRRRVVDTRPGAFERYDRWVQSGIRGKLTVLAAGCHNYYTSATGKNVTQWPHGHPMYRVVLRLLPRFGLRCRQAP